MHSTETQNSTGDATFTITSRRLERGILVALSGDLDLATARVVDEELRRAEQSEDLVVLDLSDVSFMDSTGLRMVIAADQRLRKRGASLEIRHVPPQVGRLFELVGVTKHLTIADGQAPSTDGAGASHDVTHSS